MSNGRKPDPQPADQRVLQFVCRQDGELLLLDPASAAMFTLPEDRTHLDVAALEPGGEVRVVFSGGDPAWLAAVLGSESRNQITVERLYEFLRRFRRTNMMIVFEDGDRYPVAALDFTGENPDGEFEIDVKFADCLIRSEAEAQALEAGSLSRSPGTWWSSDTPRRPVGKTYTPQQIRAVFEIIAGYRVDIYERAPTG